MMSTHIIVAAIATFMLIQNVNSTDDIIKRTERQSSRSIRQTNADQMVQNILKWLQGVYTQQTRRIRQGTFREYLPPTHTEKPRPFGHPPADGTDESGNFIGGGYPPAGITPQPPFPPYTHPTTTPTGYPPSHPSTYPTVSSSVNPTDYPTTTGGYPTGPTTGYPTAPPSGYPTAPPSGYPTRPPTGYPTTPPPSSYPTAPPSYPTGPPSYSSAPPSYPTPSSNYPSVSYPTGTPEQPKTTEQPIYSTYLPPKERPTYPTSEVSSEQPGYSTTGGYYPSSEKPGFPSTPSTAHTTEQPSYSTHEVYTTPPPLPSSSIGYPGYTTQDLHTSVTLTTSPPTEKTTTEKHQTPGDNEVTGTTTDEDLKHPPHIHALDVQCSKDMMTINIEFNRVFDGVIYSKGYYNMPECRYVTENSGQKKYTFTVNLNMCGTEFINAFDTQGQSYLENVLVLQNEAGIQEIWDTVRAVRCLWEGNLKEQLSVSLMVGMLTQEIVTFSGDTAMAKLDILLGRGPFGQPANGLVKIGEPMTLVVSVSGDPGFDIQVKDCRATDSTGDNVVKLTDDNGCVLKPKLFGAFQKTRNTENTGASIIAYAYFNAFKFPDIMDLMIECNIELCKTDCEMCPNPNEPLEPGKRRKRDLYSLNETLQDGILMGKHLRVVLPEDLIATTLNNDSFCMSSQSFMFTSILLISLFTASCLMSVCMWLKMRRLLQKH